MKLTDKRRAEIAAGGLLNEAERAAIESEITDAKANLARRYPDLVLPPGYDYSEPRT